MARASPQGAATSRRGNSPQGGSYGQKRRPQTAACIMAPVKEAGCKMPARGCHPRPALPPVGVTTPVAGVATPW
ncbi:hypothetical protein B296_00019591 [Ensete ventricosum]|uniref:Uncharacterized protein n=1 Tax=Ensete ventricosum TaxID=4639 RepID=A0A426YFG9_ENSVE|nr:hypothetical protein B296_00019591 [Ensete ventricosum]